jgi:hypothetical protein
MKILLFFLLCFLGLPYSNASTLLLSKPCVVSGGDFYKSPEISFFSQSLYDDLLAYKKSWAAFCRQENVLLSDLLVHAFKVTERIEFELSIDEKIQANFEKIETYLSGKFLQEMPAIDIQFSEYRTIKPAMKDFIDVSVYGTSEDRTFFDKYQKFYDQNLLPAWYDAVWDHGGCLKFGEFDWLYAFDDLQKLKESKIAIYRNLAVALENNLKDTLAYLYDEEVSTRVDICTCTEQSFVREDLKLIILYLQERKKMDDLREKLKVVLKRIEMGKVLIPSYQKKQCYFD